jgi:hypothetical protein
MKQPQFSIIVTATALVASLLGATIAIGLVSWSHQERPPSCTALPTRFVLQDPECAQKLLDAMNVSSVRIAKLDRFFTGPVSWPNATSRNGTPIAR